MATKPLKVASETEELHLYCYLLLINLDLKSYIWLLCGTSSLWGRHKHITVILINN